MITPCFNINSIFILSDFIFDVKKDADIVNVWTIRNVEIHAKPAKESCDVITNRLSNINLFSDQFFQVRATVATGSLSLGTISQGTLINQTEISRDVPINGNITFTMQPNLGNKVLNITDNGINHLNPGNSYMLNNITTNRNLIVNFGIIV